MKNIIKFLIIFLFLNQFLNADSFYINEPILKSKIYVQTNGNPKNEVIVFVHGLGDEASTIWESSINKLQNNYYIITFDLPGFGKSSKLDAEYTPTQYALVTDYIVSKYTNKPFYLVGHSMGGAIVLKYIELFENKVTKLMLIDVAGILHKDAYSQFLIKMKINEFLNLEKGDDSSGRISKFSSAITNGASKIMPLDLSTIVKSEPIRKNMFQTNTTAVAAVGLMAENFFKIETIKVPTFILWGEKDEVAPLRTAYVLNKLIKNSTLKIVPNSGHVPIVDSRNIYLEYLSSFLKDEIKKEANKNIIFSSEETEINNEKNIRLHGNIKSVKIINSSNIKLENCNIQNLSIFNSSVAILNSNISSKETSLDVTNSNISITATDIVGKIAIETLNSRLDLAGVNLVSNEIAILSRKKNQLIFSLTTLRSTLTNKIFHKKVAMNNEDKF